MNKPDYLVMIHRLYDKGQPKFGGLDMILESLIEDGAKVMYIESPLLPSAYPYITATLRSGGEVHERLCIKLFSATPLLARLQEIFLLIYLPIRLGLKNTVTLTSDPLTSAPAIILRKVGFLKYVYYHCIDYSEVRFTNKILNYIYKTLLDFGLSSADLVGYVTPQIHKLLLKKGITNCFYVPNSVRISKIKHNLVPVENRIKNRLIVTCAGMSHKYRVVETINLFSNIVKKFPDATLVLIGSLSFEPKEYDEIKKTVEESAAKNRITFLGQLSRDENLKELAKAWVGLAFYDKSYSHVNFGDSLKIREYAALGLPTVSDKTTPTAQEMLENRAGVAVDEPWDAEKPLVELLSDESAYRVFSENAIKWADKTDKDKIVKNLVKLHLHPSNEKYKD